MFAVIVAVGDAEGVATGTSTVVSVVVTVSLSVYVTVSCGVADELDMVVMDISGTVGVVLIAEVSVSVFTVISGAAVGNVFV